MKVIVQQVTLFEKKRDTLPFLVFNSLERNDVPCKSDSQHFTLFEKKRDNLPILVYNSPERKNDPCESDSSTSYPF